MQRLRCLVVIGALAVVVCAVAADPALAAKGGNNDTAGACQHGGWMTLVPAAGGTFANQGDCVNDGAQASGFSDANGSQTCGNIGGTFRVKGPTSWICTYDGDSAHTADLQTACTNDGGQSFFTESNGIGQTLAICQQA
jgi:hypothetical protein